MFTGSHNSKNSLARRAIALLVLVAILAASTPIPLGGKPIPPTGAASFPCQTCACGCGTAEQCWTNCCCFSPAQRRQWAADNGVTPPAYAVLDDAAIAVVISNHSSCPSALQACQTVPSDSCSACLGANESLAAGETLATEQAPTSCDRTCCSEPPAAGSDSLSAEPAPSVWVLSVIAVKCHGGATDFTLLPWAIVASLDGEAVPPAPLCESLVLSDVHRLSPTHAPTAPPPRATLFTCFLEQVS